MNLDTEVLNEQRPRGAHDRRPAIDAGAHATEREAEAQKEAASAAQQRDRTLIETYLTVEDIERLRDQRLEQLQAQAHVTEQNIVNLQRASDRG